MNRFYVYKCINDDGGAPCVERGLLTLCICKPAIRSTANVGDVIFAFASNRETPANRLVYIAVVTRKLTDGEYYELNEYRDRSDCIYERTSTGRFQVRRDSRFHGNRESLIKDVGIPPFYANGNSLLSYDFRYFGASGTADWKERAPELKRLVESLKQGHRVIRDRALRDELLKLKESAWRQNRRKVLGRPLHAPESILRANCDRPRTASRRRCYDRRGVC